MTDTIEGEILDVHDEPGTDLEPVREVAPATLFGTDDPIAVIEKATQIADALAKVIEQKKLYTVMGKDKQGVERRHVKVEGWTLLGSMLGVFPETEWTKETRDSNGNLAYEARVIARTRDGTIVGAREAMCSKSEPNWKTRDDYAIKSMAQTRATSGALAQPLRFIVVLAGFEGTPESEMPTGEAREEKRVETQIPVPKSWAEVLERAKAHLEDEDAPIWLAQAKGAADKLPAPTAFQRLCGVIVDLDETHIGDFPPMSRTAIREAFAARLDGIQLEGPEWVVGSGDDETEKGREPRQKEEK